MKYRKIRIVIRFKNRKYGDHYLKQNKYQITIIGSPSVKVKERMRVEIKRMIPSEKIDESVDELLFQLLFF